MPWEERGACRYYYRKTRVDGKVVTEYVGSGLLAEAASLIDKRERNQRELAKLEWQCLVADQRRVDHAIGTYRAQLVQLVGDVLCACGYHQHKGQWRKARKMDKQLPPSGRGPEADEYLDRYRLAIGKPAKSDEVMRLKVYARDHPQVFDHVTYFAESTLMAVIESASPTETTRVQMAGEIAALRHSLGEASATPLEKLLIEDIAICWLRMHLTEQLYSLNFKSPGMTVEHRDFWDRHLTSARRRHLASIESLARVRGLLSRAGVQINIAQQQIVDNG